MPHRSSNRHTLGPAQFEHTLYILSKEWRFNGKISGLVFRNQATDCVEDELQPLIRIFYFAGFQYTQFQQTDLVTGNTNQSVPHHQGTGINPQYYFIRLYQGACIFTRLMQPDRTSKSGKYRFFINYILGPLLFVWLSWSIYRQISQQPGLSAAWQRIKASVDSPLIWNGVAIVLLMWVNWSLEALKWKLSVKPVQVVSFNKALQAILSGVSFSVSTPNRIGEYLGRVLYMNEGNRLKTISITIVGSISQLIITLLAGLIGLVLLRQEILDRQLMSAIWMNVVVYGVLTVLTGLLLFYFRLSWLIRWLDRIPGMKRFAYLVEALEDFHPAMLLRLLLLSLLRFGVFILQYWLCFQLFDVQLSGSQTLWTISVAFLVMAVIPTIAIAELAQRGKVVIAITGIYSANELGMTFATAGIWFINLIVPAIIGSLLILRMRKIIRDQEPVQTSSSLK